MDRIALRGVRVHGRHGANPGERDRDQPFIVDLVVELDLRVPEKSDALRDTLDYAALHAQIVRTVATTSFALLERLAGEILNAVLANPRIVRAAVTVSKPEKLDGATPSVTLTRGSPLRSVRR